jgi:hypothetical protein
MMMLNPGRIRRPADELELRRDAAGTYVLARRGVPVAYFSHEAEARQAMESLRPRAAEPAPARSGFWPDDD